MKTKVFVTDGISPATPSIIESLAKNGYEVYCGEEFYWNASFFSRYLKKAVIYPSPEKEPEKYIDFLLDYLKSNDIHYLIPVRCPSFEQIIKNKNKFFPDIKFLAPELEDWLKAEFKHETLKIADQINFPMPKTLFDEKLDYKSIGEKLGNDFIIKVSRSSGARGILPIHSEEDLEYHKKHLTESGSEFVFQEWIPQGGRSFNASYLFDFDGNARTGFLMEKIRQYPIKGGSTSFAMGIENDELLSIGEELLKGLNWKGVAEVEYIQDPRDGKYKLMEINPRFWNPTLLAIKAGIDYPKYIMDILTGHNGEINKKYRTDVSFSFLPYEILNFLNSFKISSLRSLIPFGKNFDVFYKLNDIPLFFGFIFQSFYLLKKKRREFVSRDSKKLYSGDKSE